MASILAQKHMDILRKKAGKKNGPGCFICRLILEDLETRGEITDGMLDYMGISMLPAKAKRRHLVLEGIRRR